MNRKAKSLFTWAIFMTVLAVAFSIVVMNVDVRENPCGGTVGLATVNEFFRAKIGVNDFCFQVSEITGIVALCIVGVFALIGLVEWISRKNMWKVDKSILLLGALYLIVLGLYFLFNKVAFNYRPILVDGEAEASFPSSHTMLAITVYFTAAVVFGEMLSPGAVSWIARIGFGLLLLITVVCRFLSGYHWFTDVVAGIFISVTLVLWFFAVREAIEQKTEGNEA